MLEYPARLDDQQRVRLLDQAVSYRLVGRGQLVSRTEFEAVIAYAPAPINHVLQLLLTVFTCGLWGVIWLILILAKPGEIRQVGTVDEFGRVFWR